MPRLIPKNNPKYDHSIDIDAVVSCSPQEAAFALMSSINPEHHKIESQTPESVVVSGRSLMGMTNIWITASFAPVAGGTNVGTRVTRAHTAAFMYIFFIPIGRKKIRGIGTYHNLLERWNQALTSLNAQAATA